MTTDAANLARLLRRAPRICLTCALVKLVLSLSCLMGAADVLAKTRTLRRGRHLPDLRPQRRRDIAGVDDVVNPRVTLCRLRWDPVVRSRSAATTERQFTMRRRRWRHGGGG